MSENKVQFNLKNVAYAVLDDSGSTPSWGTPVKVPGAVSLTLAAEGETTPFYADGVTYYQTENNNGYSGELEMAKIPVSMLKDIWGFTQDSTSKVIVEKNNVEAKYFALLFQIDGDQGNEKYLFYRCTATRPSIASQTNTESKEPQPQTLSISCLPMIGGTMDGAVQARTTYETTSTVDAGWFSSVWTLS